MEEEKKYNYFRLTPFKWFVLENFPFIEADFDALTNWQLFCKLGKEINKIIDSQNSVGQEMENLSQAFINLQEYVDNYFDNLDVTTEVNNKLDEMAEDGTLAQIMTEYLNIKAILCFDNISSMKNASNVIEGSYLQTYGFYNLGDGGNAKYIVRTVRTADVIDDITIVALTNYENLVAELIIEDNINVKQFGCKGDGETNDSSNMVKAFTFANSLNKNIYLPAGNYIVSSKLYVNSDLMIIGDNAEIVSSDLDETIVLQENAKLTIKDIKISTASGIAIHINQPNIENVILDNVTIDSEGYGFLLNSNTANGNNLKIVNSNIKGKSDGIELNLTNETDIFNTIVIANNIVESKSTGSGYSSGFAIGISKGKRVIIDGNIIPYSRLEAIHVEAGTEETIITNNILHECDGEGIRLLPLNTVTQQTPKIANNIIKGKDQNDYGIRCVYDSNGSFNQIDLINNFIENFNIGITSEQQNATLNVDGTTIKNCNVAIAGNPHIIKGKLNLINTPKLTTGTSSFNTIEFDEIIKDTLTDDFITANANNLITIKRLQTYKTGVVSKSNNMITVPIMKIPTYFKGTISLVNTVANNQALCLFDVEIKDGTVTKTNINVSHYGNISSSNLIENNGYLCYYAYAPNIADGGNVGMRLDFNGILAFKNYNV